MKTLPILAIVAAAALAFTACERKPEVVEIRVSDEKPVAQTRTFETSRLTAAIDSFAARPTAENSADAKKAFAELDGEIAELQARVAKTTGADRDEAAVKLENLESFRAAETLRFTKAQATAGLGVVSPADARSGSEKIEDTARDTGDKIEAAAKRTGEALEDAAKKTGDAIKDLAR